MRGISSVTGENRPLIVVDGVPLDNTNVNNVDTREELEEETMGCNFI